MNNDVTQKRAIALGFEQGTHNAPVVQATGSEDVAREIIRAARRYGIPIHQEPKLAEQLRQVARDSEIPTELYDQVAEVLVRCHARIAK